MTKEYVEVTIDMDTGDSSVEAFGYKDGKCRVATEDLEKALGKVKARVVKDQNCDPSKVTIGSKK
jgi:hypothetical protein